MRARLSRRASALILLALAGTALSAQTEVDRSAAMKQLAGDQTMAERSSAAFDQISTVDADRARVDQIDPTLAAADLPDGDELSAGEPAARAAGCGLTPEQQSIVTSLASQGRLPAGDCEMIAWLTRPGDKSESEDRQSVAEAVMSGAPELLGRDAEADRLAQLELEQRQAEATAFVFTVLPPAPVPPGK
ncbi:MAG: hypothetical protein Q8L84_06150 [Hyphomonas sp.]|nr:hypothetical protein [Hyphomonas sp.]